MISNRWQLGLFLSGFVVVVLISLPIYGMDCADQIRVGTIFRNALASFFGVSLVSGVGE